MRRPLLVYVLAFIAAAALFAAFAHLAPGPLDDGAARPIGRLLLFVAGGAAALTSCGAAIWRPSTARRGRWSARWSPSALPPPRS